MTGNLQTAHAHNTPKSFHVSDYGITQALQRTTSELPPGFELRHEAQIPDSTGTGQE